MPSSTSLAKLALGHEPFQLLWHEEEKEEEEEEKDQEVAVEAVLAQLLFLISLLLSLLLVSGIIFSSVLVLPDGYMIWILLGDDFWVCFRMFPRSSVDTVHASTFSTRPWTSDPEVNSRAWRRLRSTRNCILTGRRLQEHSPYFRVCLVREWFYLMRQST